ncbi:uncharacterized protein TRUGW13939_07847 [Talaromyces rugulosus]|uniref:Uncharacterized protein n=1 Tax=Talaromyces rugulosus TaxID=121627 RepID=A0A7H8R4U4_TALRU|nr:uncharacterized protein TRUGW13939_07847 [Talaromyces rugulosus]QKX60701.1 hypothetical protein TRUGW13939_07847 [Talaromyces rugulosus]
MNKFRRTKKVKEPVEPEAAPTASMGFMGSNKFKKNKAADIPVQPALDLENALPSSDNFRTSLLMPNLSARFSMLREQDDPTSKLGKANDDSVLFPKRQSRLNLFGHNPSPLTDIAEVASIGGRSSFNIGRTDSTVDEMGRTNSYASADDFTDDSSTHGGVMNRKRPGEGNNLFGGRQKVYKIPISSSGKDIGSKGKSVYEDDVHLSAFQKMRLREREEKARMGLMVDEVHDLSTPEYEDVPSFLAKRTTSSSTTSGHSNPRTSTAATSIDEQPLSNIQTNGAPPSPTKKSTWVPPTLMGHVSKTRRLYGQNQDQPPSPFNRFETLSRQNSGAGTPERPSLSRTFSRSASNLSERHQRLSPANPSSAGSRTYSPTTSANSPQLETADSQQQDRTSGSSSISPSGYGIVPPLSPPVSDNEEMSALNAHLQPEDRGKATAMGLFNKPTGPFDEQQFMRRQLQMHEGRNTPPVMTRQSPSNSVSRPEPVRSRGLSNASYRSKAESASSRYSDDVPGSRAHSVRDYSPPRTGTFMLNLDASDSEGQAGDEQSLKKVSSVKSQAFDGIHPAFRSRPTSRDSDVAYPPRESFDFPEVKYPDRDLNPIQENTASPPSPILEEASERAQDSPTLGPAGLGLSSMIRTHLRHDSAQSSIYPNPPSPRASVHQDVIPFRLDTDLVKESQAESDELVSPKTEIKPPSYPPPEPPVSGFSSVALRAKQLRDQAAALREQTNQARESSESDRLTEMPPSSQPDLNFGHRRGSSTETQKEREDFANELAERRRRVQENLHRIGSRSNSPASGRQTPDVGSGRTSNTFSALKSRAGKNSPPDRSIPATRALKKLGMGSASMNSSTPSLDSWREDEMSHGLGKHSNSSSPQVGSGRQRPFRGAPSRTTSYGSQEDPEPIPSRTASPARQSRDRSTSTSGRSKSRARPRDDLGMVAEDPVSHPPSRGSPIVPSSARPSVDIDDGYARERSGSATFGGVSRSSSRAPAPGQVDLTDSHHRPSPMAAYSANATPPLEGPESGMSYVSQSSPTYNSISQRSPTSNNLPKRQVDKWQISEPTFVSTTSNVPIVDLHAAASLPNGVEIPPAVPPMNPRRKRTGTGTGSMHRPQTASARSSQDERRPMTSFDDEKRQLAHQRLRKMSSEGTSLHGRSRPGTITAPANYPPPPTTSVEGGMI